ncbi:hypothetical protein ACFOJ6_25015 [Gordonia humi]
MAAGPGRGTGSTWCAGSRARLGSSGSGSLTTADGGRG